ncbi:MAG: DNA polymerase III subunit alpha, partial [Alphaproteobacteria bacterium]
MSLMLGLPAEGDGDEVAVAASAQQQLRPAGRLALYAQSETGYRNLMKLITCAYFDAPEGLATFVTLDDLRTHHEGIICLTGGPSGPINQLVGQSRLDTARDLMRTLADIFPNRLYAELQRTGLAHEVEAETLLIETAYADGLPLVATNDAYFPEPEFYDAHDALLCIAEGSYLSQDDRTKLTPDCCFKSPDEMVKLFEDLPEAIENTLEIAKRCAYRPLTQNPILPRFAGDEAAEAKELRRQAEEGLAARLKGYEAPHPQKDYEDRLAFELDVIEKMGFPGYFLIVADFIKWSKNNDIPVGPGRGSGAGSVVAWALTITDLDPLRFGLLFERFLNPERVSMPDFDIDFCQDRRDEVIRYVQDKYGKDRVAQIITFGKLQARAVLRDVGRVLQMPYGQVDRLTKMVPNNPASPVTLKEAIEGEPRMQQMADEEEVVADLLRVGQQLEGLFRHASTHAAGVVIGDRPLDELVPLYRDPRSEMAVTQFNMKWVEPAGLVKFDFLGLKTLTVIQTAIKLLKERGVEVDIDTIPLDDVKSYEMMTRGETVGVFQLESSGMRDMLRRLKPDCFEDVIAMVALYRPGPMDNIPKFIATKAGEEEPNYHHPMLEGLLKETYGVIVYQEQVMQIAQILAGYSLGEADLLRRAMGKKIQAEMDKQRVRFVEGATKKGVDAKDADNIFDLVNKFAGYGFNKSHAAAYALVAYQTAWLKANHPVEFMAASMTYDMTNTDKLAVFKAECMRAGIEVMPPCVNRSAPTFTVVDGKIAYALGAVKNVGRPAMEQMVAARQADGPFSDLFDFVERVDARLVNKRSIENLARAGAFDALHANRQQIVNSADILMSYGATSAEERQSDQASLFGGEAGTALERPRLKDTLDWPPMEKLGEEFGAIGFYLSGHPLDDFKQVLEREKISPWVEYAADVKRKHKL